MKQHLYVVALNERQVMAMAGILLIGKTMVKDFDMEEFGPLADRYPHIRTGYGMLAGFSRHSDHRAEDPFLTIARVHLTLDELHEMIIPHMETVKLVRSAEGRTTLPPVEE